MNISRCLGGGLDTSHSHPQLPPPVHTSHSHLAFIRVVLASLVLAFLPSPPSPPGVQYTIMYSTFYPHLAFTPLITTCYYRRFIIQRVHEHTRTVNYSESGFWEPKGSSLEYI